MKKTLKNTKKHLIKAFWGNQAGGVSGMLVIVFIIVILISLGIGFGFGRGTGKGVGNGNGKGEEYISDDVEDKTTNGSIPTNSPTITPAPKEFSIVVERTEILFDNEKFSNAQSLIDVIQKKVETGEGILIVLHDENAIADTLEDVKNTLDKNNILWVTPTPMPTSKE